MVENTPASKTVEKVDTTVNVEQTTSDGTRNTGVSQVDFDKGVDVGFAKGATKATRELFDKVGIDNLDEIVEAVSFKHDYEESQKSAAEQLDTLKNDNKDLKKQLKIFTDQSRAEAETVFKSLNEDQQAAVKAANLPLENMVPVMRTLLGNSPAVKTTVGTSFQPNTPEPTGLRLNMKSRTGVDPDYRKDPDGYIAKKLEEYNRTNQD